LRVSSAVPPAHNPFLPDPFMMTLQGLKAKIVDQSVRKTTKGARLTIATNLHRDVCLPAI
jgi:hypothetical protein